MSLSLLARLAVIWGGIMVLVILLCLLALAARSDTYDENLAEMGWEEDHGEDSPLLVGKVQSNEPLDELRRMARRSRSGLWH